MSSLYLSVTNSYETNVGLLLVVFPYWALQFLSFKLKGSTPPLHAELKGSSQTEREYPLKHANRKKGEKNKKNESEEGNKRVMKRVRKMGCALSLVSGGRLSGKGRVNGMIVVCMCVLIVVCMSVLIAVQSVFAKQLLRGMEEERERGACGGNIRAI